MVVEVVVELKGNLYSLVHLKTFFYLSTADIFFNFIFISFKTVYRLVTRR